MAFAKLIISGFLAKDPTTNSGLQFDNANFRVAINKGTDKETMFLNCSASGKIASRILKDYHKGSSFTGCGELESYKKSNPDAGNSRIKSIYYFYLKIREICYPASEKEDYHTTYNNNQQGQYQQPSNGYQGPSQNAAPVNNQQGQYQQPFNGYQGPSQNAAPANNQQGQYQQPSNGYQGPSQNAAPANNQQGQYQQPSNGYQSPSQNTAPANNQQGQYQQPSNGYQGPSQNTAPANNQQGQNQQPSNSYQGPSQNAAPANNQQQSQSEHADFSNDLPADDDLPF